MRRPLTPAERALLEAVFASALPLDAIAVSDRTGPRGTPLALPSWRVPFRYHLHVGACARGELAAVAWSARLLVHEATHVWQGEHGPWRWGYVVRSALAQARALLTSGTRRAAYTYVPGAPWSTYNPEQQASIVEDWYASGMDTGSALWPYVRDSIRRPGPRPSAEAPPHA